MKHTVTKFEFIDSIMRVHDNAINEAFTTEALELLWYWYDSIYDASLYEDREFYPSDISGEWTQYKNIEEFRENYSDDYEDLDDIRDETIVIEIDDESFLAMNTI
tara:strand:+ start:5222 stop:5536 length:315 start_codon:yes stop_codon:yes gene_type:complete